MREVPIEPVSLDRVAQLLPPDRAAALRQQIRVAQRLFAGRVVWNVNATSQGGGVAELLQSLLAYSRGVGVDARWLVLDGSNEFFRVTKRVHNALHGSPGDGGPLGPVERAIYEQVLARNAQVLTPSVSAEDVVILHDPQTAALVPVVKERGATVIWRCHVGIETRNDRTELGWSFLRPYLDAADIVAFTRAEYAPHWVPPEKLRVVQPSIDPFSAKNLPLEPQTITNTLVRAGLVEDPPGVHTAQFVRRTGTVGLVRSHDNLVYGGSPPPLEAPLVVQVSRWDHLKDMAGVLRGFTEAGGLPEEAHLMLVGPDVFGVDDDPEGHEVFQECQQQWLDLPAPWRRRTHLVCLPMDDVDENAHLVNALQRHAAVVVQKSIHEGFGLTVTEAMWKARPVVASAVGGIRDQIADGRDGFLVDDPADLAAFGDAVAKILGDPQLARRLGEAAQARVRDQFLADRQLIQYVEMIGQLKGFDQDQRQARSGT